jgi:hypothetical protein
MGRCSVPSNYPKFDQKINDQIIASRMQQSRPRMGTVVEYNRTSNTITVVLESQYSDTVGNIVNKIPCPSTYGIQTVAPEPGDRCVIGFRDENERFPYVISFLNDYPNERAKNSSIANTGIPRYMI